ncbi:MAG TPA: dihydrodipicolinate reductase C-terminal domain-containing protein [Vicinamibacterales bacterium]|nr:dihydrodipicolinate reductase C-terminal domain-containing protein [Vicinamibacterales bacterium]
MKLLLVGHGKMGRMVESLAAEYGGEIAGVLDPLSPRHGGGPEAAAWNGVDVAIDFSAPAVVAGNATVLARRGINLVIGTTAWQKDEAAVRDAVKAGGGGAVVAANFSTGVVLFDAIVSRAAALFAAQPDFGAFVHEAHHAAKKDAPSGTALQLKKTMEQAGFTGAINVSSARAGFIPGTHTIGFDGPAETITLTHVARDRSGFARGALTAAKWVVGKRGWFTMKDVLGLTS